MKPDHHEIGVGATEELSLRVSVAALVRVLFDGPEDGRTMLALERTAKLREIEGRPEVTVRAKPFGGGLRVTNPQALRRANATLDLGLDDLKDVYRSIQTDKRGGLIRVGEHQFDGNVPVILKEIDKPKYQRHMLAK